MAITLDGTTGITTPGLTNTGTETIVNLTTTGNTILGDASTDTLNVGNGGLVKDASGNVGVGVTPSAWRNDSKAIQVGYAGSIAAKTGTELVYLSSNFYEDGTGIDRYINTAYASQYYQVSGTHVWRTAPSGTAGNAITWTQAMTLNASGNLGIGVTPRAWTSASGFRAIDFTYGSVYNATNTMGMTQNAYYNGTNFIYNQTSLASYYYQNGGTHNWYTAPSGTAGNAITFTAGMALDAQRRLSVVSQGNGYNPIAVTAGTRFNAIFASSNNGLSTASYGGANTADTALYMGKDGTTNRSINAGGTVNASGADYAEYMTKVNDFALAKGGVVGIDANGKLTNVYADAVSFVVKSTDPSYVGGDTWGSAEAINLIIPERPVRAEDDTDETFADKEAQYTADKAIFDEALEAARQLVDRIAFAGQVPVNVLGATAGQYIIPVNDNGAIKGEAVSSPTFEQYQAAVGKVIAIEADGRARIIVKVA
jgi:hypothetical protein